MSESSFIPECVRCLSPDNVKRIFKSPRHIFVPEGWNKPTRKALKRKIKYFPVGKENCKIFVGNDH